MNLGTWGETRAASYLIQNGYKILDRNYICCFGELDLIASKDETVCFVEVKTRRSLCFGEPCEAVTKRKQTHIQKTIQMYLMKKKLNPCNLRIDVIELLILDKKVYLRHIENAF